MKICMLTTSFPAYSKGYQSPFVYRLARSIVKKNIDLNVIAPFYRISRKKYEVMDGIKVHRFQYLPLRYQSLTEKGGLPSNFKKRFSGKIEILFYITAFFIKSLKIAPKTDIIHCQWVLSALVGLPFRALYTKPLILTLRGADANMSLNNFFLKKIFTFVLKHCDCVVSNNKYVARLVSGLNIRLKSKIKVISNGVDLDIFKPRDKQDIRKKLGLPLNKRIILFTGWLIERKGVTYLISAVEKIIKQKKDVLFIILGDGQLKEELLTKVKYLKIENYIKFVGPKPPEEIPYWMSAADIFILPSLSEGMPNVVMEAMASGLPVIATSVSGTPELIEDGKNGFLIPPKNSEDIEKRVIQLLNDQHLSDKIGDNARKSIFERNLTWDSSAEKYIKIYRTLKNAPR